MPYLLREYARAASPPPDALVRDEGMVDRRGGPTAPRAIARAQAHRPCPFPAARGTKEGREAEIGMPGPSGGEG